MNKYKQTLDSLNTIYTSSQEKVEKVKKTTKGYKNQAIFICNQSADDLLDYLEDKLTVDVGELTEKDKIKRVKKIFTHLKKETILSPISKATQFNNTLVQKGKDLGR